MWFWFKNEYGVQRSDKISPSFKALSGKEKK